MKGNKNMKKLGFTLAEVLITLVIIGVIAAMTIPTLMNNTNSQEFRSAFKKAISMTNQALTLNYALNGMTASDYKDSQELVDNVFKKRLSVVDTDGEAFTLTSVNCANTGLFITADGMMFCVTGFEGGSDTDTEGTGKCDSYNTLPCGTATASQLWIDVNGVKGPNAETTSANRPKDIYQAQIFSQKVIPFGEAAQQVMYEKGSVSSTKVTHGDD